MGGPGGQDRKKDGMAAQGLVNDVQTSAFDTSRKATWAEFTPRLTVEYELAPAAMVYANYSQGYKAGGFNSRGTTPENIGPYGPEHVNAFEVGAKTDLFDRLLRFNVAGFVNNYRNLQGSVTTMGAVRPENITTNRSEEHTSELQSIMRISYAVFCLKKQTQTNKTQQQRQTLKEQRKE